MEFLRKNWSYILILSILGLFASSVIVSFFVLSEHWQEIEELNTTVTIFNITFTYGHVVIFISFYLALEFIIWIFKFLYNFCFDNIQKNIKKGKE